MAVVKKCSNIEYIIYYANSGIHGNDCKET